MVVVYSTGKDDEPKANPFGFQGFKKTGGMKKLMGSKKITSSVTPSRKTKTKNTKPMRSGDGRVMGTGTTKGSLAHFMNGELGVKTKGGTGLRKTVFETEEERKLHGHRAMPNVTIGQYRSSKISRQQMQAAKSLGSIFMSGAKDKCTGKILLPSSLKKSRKKS